MQISWHLKEKGTLPSFEGCIEETAPPILWSGGSWGPGEPGCPSLGRTLPGPRPTSNPLLSFAEDRSLAEEKGLCCQNPDCMDKGRAAKVGWPEGLGAAGGRGDRALTALSVQARKSTGPWQGCSWPGYRVVWVQGWAGPQGGWLRRQRG